MRAPAEHWPPRESATGYIRVVCPCGWKAEGNRIRVWRLFRAHHAEAEQAPLVLLKGGS